MARCAFWNMASGWLCAHLAEYWRYTGDEAFLRHTAWPLCKSAAQAYLALLTPDERGLILGPSTSPENAYIRDGQRHALSRTTAMTMAIVRELLEDCLSMARALGLEEDDFLRRARWSLAHLAPEMCIRDSSNRSYINSAPGQFMSFSHSNMRGTYLSSALSLCIHTIFALLLHSYLSSDI